MAALWSLPVSAVPGAAVAQRGGICVGHCCDPGLVWHFAVSVSLCSFCEKQTPKTCWGETPILKTPQFSASAPLVGNCSAGKS